ncbi:MAG: tetratricopeptide repeat protein [bacterium]
MKKMFILVLLVLLPLTFIFAGNPQLGQQYLQAGNQYLKTKQYDNAIKYYDASVQQDPTDAAYYAMGVAYYYKGDKANALASAQQALKINPSNANAQKIVNTLSSSMEVVTAPAANPQAAQYLQAGNKYLQAKQYDQAIQYYNASIKIQPTAGAYQYLGTAYYYKNDIENAKIAYGMSLQLDPSNTQVRGILAKLGENAPGNTAAEPRLGQTLGVSPLLLAAIFAGALAAIFFI